MPTTHPVVILGAGPAGSTAALRLHQLGIPCTLIDKASFPRDKVCGDMLSGKVSLILKRINPQLLERFQTKATVYNAINGLEIIAPNQQCLSIALNNYANLPAAYTSKRLDFDNFLIQEVKRCSNITLKQHCQITDIQKVNANGVLSPAYQLTTKDGTQINTQLLLVANGAQSYFSKHIAGIHKENKHYGAAVRMYCKDIEGLTDSIELYFLKDYLPGYFWIFPLANGEANIGFGMRSDHISKRRINLKKTLLSIIQDSPQFRKRFIRVDTNAPIHGYGLPLGSKRRSISGENYMLLGDAAHLVDPLTGEGIGNALYSGFIAADQVALCLKNQVYSASFMQQYDKRIHRVIGKELRLSYTFQNILQYPRLANTLIGFASRHKGIITAIGDMYNDFSVRKQLVNPGFWIRTLLKK